MLGGKIIKVLLKVFAALFITTTESYPSRQLYAKYLYIEVILICTLY